MEMEIRFAGNKKVDAHFKDFVVETDQAKEEGGDGEAPEPFDLFMASMGTCAGIYVVYFCQERDIDLTGARMRVEFDQNDQSHLIEHVWMKIDLPPGFPSKYRKAVIRAAEMCTVKRNLARPPGFTVEASIRAAASG